MTYTKEQAKEVIKELIDKYERIKSQGRIKSYNEEMTKKDFIIPMFEALGWDVYNKKEDEVTAEEKVSRGRVDYAFRIGGISKFFLECKSLKEDLELDKWAHQAMTYSWHKNVTWAVLANFENIKVFNAEIKTINPSIARLFEIPYEQYLDRFDQLWLLSKESFENGIIDKEAERWGKKLKKIPVDKQLLSDLTDFREILSKNIVKNNKNLTQDDLDESVQRIIDRLIFIRTCEDKGLEDHILLPLIREQSNKKHYKKLSKVFREFDDIYNSKLFVEHLCDNLIIDDEILEKVIRGLFRTSENTISYDFGFIDADVLGNIYEQYLGHILKKTDKRAKLTDGKVHRKEQGIYYTPTYIVDYIVKNTIGELAKDKKFDISKIKVLDPACGSGSFLIKSFDYLVALNSKKSDFDQIKLDITGEGVTYSKKLDILKNNIFGVDLDSKAVEIAQLNLLLKVAEKKHRLPILQENIKVGNSLIDDSEIAGNKAFKWEEEFEQIMKDGGFDVVIGNPPYVFGGNFGIKNNEKDFFKKYYLSAKRKLNLFSLFMERSIRLLKNDGVLAFILPNTLLRVTSYEEIRKLILEKTKILQIINLEPGVFEGVTASTIIIVLQKEKNKNLINKHKIKIFNNIQNKYESKLQNEFLNNLHIFDLACGTDNRLIEKINSGCIKLGDICKEMIFGVVITKNKDEVVSDRKINSQYKKFLEGRDIERYRIKFSNKYLLYERSKLHRPRTPEIFETEEKILMQRISGGRAPLKAAYDNEQFYNKESINNIILVNKNFNLKYILALLNSNLINWFYSTKFTNASTLTVNVSKAYLSNIPIKSLSPLDQQPLINLVDSMLSLNKRLNEIGEKKTDERIRIEKEIEKTDREIDELVYKLYGLTEKEIRIVEGK